ncbi:MAG: ABC transporter permease [Candidatus Auribacter fodinae]|uniref:ABC transporter permease n=1 Tax=Candidatus Auribacter fodinae TaxID=2093366 RepID=A0A3A4RFP8_9BACT|nr:MAG: ABC transporter permease [Candidatus Auribacter fodinae]
MLKTIIIGFKDLRLVFRDRAALVFMLLAPFLLTIGMGFVTGRFSGNSGGIQDIPVIIVNLDNAELGDALVDVFNSEDLAELVEPATSSDPEAARQLIDDNQAAAAVIIPEGFTRSIIPAEGTMTDPNFAEADPISIEVYVNPAKPTSAGVIKAIVDEFVSRVDEGRTSGMTTIFQMLMTGVITPQQAETEGRSLFEDVDQTESTALTLKTDDEGAQAVEFDILAYMAPGMALLFLMYTVSYGGRSILAERAQGTLPRLLVSPTSSAQILGGKVFGIYLTGVAQISILILASAIFFQVKWGDPLGMTALILAAVFGATGWGMLITAFARNPNQVASIGSAIMLIFGILGGSFIDLGMMPPAIQFISKITPNAWALDGFTTLALGGGLAQLTEPIVALLIMGVVLFAVSVMIFGKKNLAQK